MKPFVLTRAAGLISALCCCLMLTACANTGTSAVTSNDASSNAHDVYLERAQIHTELAAGYFERAQYSIALDEAHTALDSDKNYAAAYDILGLIYMALNEIAPAQENFDHALALAPNEPEIHNNYGWFLCSQKRYDEAMKQFNTAIANPLYTKPQNSLTNAGLCEINAGHTLIAEGYLEKSLRLDRSQPKAQIALAEIYYQQGRYAEADMLIHDPLGDNPDAKLLWLAIRIAHKTNNSNTEATASMLLRSHFPDAPETRLLNQGNYD